MHYIKPYLPWSLAATIFLIPQYLRWQEPLGLDQSLFACFGLWLPAGAVPYLDIWDSKPPGLFYIYACAFELLGQLPTTIRLLDIAATAATAIGLFFLSKKVSPSSTGLWSAALGTLLVHSPSFGGYWSSAQAESFIGPLVLLALLLGLHSAKTANYLAVCGAGLALGSAGMLKIPALAFAAPVVVLLLCHRTYRLIAGLALGLTIPVAATFSCLWSAGALSAFLEAMVTYSPLYLEAVTPPDYEATVRSVLSSTVTGNVSFAFLCIAGLSTFLWQKQRHHADSAMLLTWWLTTIAVICIQRQFAGYHLLLLLAPTALFAGIALNRIVTALGQPGSSRILALVAIVATTITLGRDLLSWEPYYRHHVSYRAGRLNEEQFKDYFGTALYDPVTQERLGNYIRRQSNEDETLLVWGMAPAIYFFARRLPATKYLFHHLLLTDAPLSRKLPGLATRREHLLRRIEEQPPTFILVGLADPNAFEPLDSLKQLRRFPDLLDYLNKHYQPDSLQGRYRVYRRQEQHTEDL